MISFNTFLKRHIKNDIKTILKNKTDYIVSNIKIYNIGKYKNEKFKVSVNIQTRNEGVLK